MTEEKNKKKGFWAGLLDSLDKKMKDKAKSSSCCCSGSCDANNDDEEKKC
ncbi:MAG: hypothetical protein KKD07_07655 [Candidatus Omnitrophica bacterium]|nr:hypothetical protein [Candidatus Omnitrophota bacterium]MBU1997073.1 hypothetical protein [Candidatus Omnitrophota bacterium]MBU4334296.1 hypothetical protein [Candidatus Omnitrophota bacterium]